MKRFFLVFALASVCASIVSLEFSLSFTPVVVISAILILVAVLTKFVYFKKISVSLLVFAIIFSLFFGYCDLFSYLSNNNLHKLEGQTCEISASIIDEVEDKDSYYVYYIETSYVGISEAPQNVKTILYSSNLLDAEVFDEISGNITFSNNFDSIHTDYKADGYFTSANTFNLSVTPTSVKPTRSKFINLKNDIKLLFRKNLPKDVAGIPLAILTGDKSEISDEFYSNIKSTGMAHVLAVSGLHISIICSSVVMLLLKLKVHKKFSYFIGLLIVFFLAALAGFSGSIMRATVMYSVIVLSKIFVRSADTLNSLGFAVTVLLFITPYNIYSVSFVLSTLGTLGIVVLMPKLKDKIDNLFKKKNVLTSFLSKHVNSFAVSICASATITPYSLFVFGYVSIIAPIVNVILTFPVYWLLISTVLSVVFCKIPVLSDILFWVVKVLSYVFKYVIDLFAESCNIGFFKDDEFLYIFLATLGILALIWYIFRNRKLIKPIIALVLVLSLSTTLFCQSVFNKNKTKIHIVDSNFPCMVIERGEHAAIIGIGESNRCASNINKIINSNFLTVDLFVIPKITNKNSKQISKILSKHNVKCIASPKYGSSKKYNASLNDFKAKLWSDIVISSIKTKNTFNISVLIDNEIFLLENEPLKLTKADNVLTYYPESSYKFHKNTSKYFLFGEPSDAVTWSSILTNKGAKTAISNQIGDIVGTKYAKNPTNFYRIE